MCVDNVSAVELSINSPVFSSLQYFTRAQYASGAVMQPDSLVNFGSI